MTRPTEILCAECGVPVPVLPIGRIPVRCEAHRGKQYSERTRPEDVQRGISQRAARKANEAAGRIAQHSDDLARLAIALSVHPDPAAACVAAGLAADDPAAMAAEARAAHGDLADPGDYSGIVRRTRAAYATALHTLHRRIPEIAPGQLSNVIRSLSQALAAFAETDSAPRYTEITLSLGETKVE